jgi:hypothetical protein
MPGPKIRCKHCNDIIQSTHRHDYVTCKCGKVSVDGGSDYLKLSHPSRRMDDDIEILERITDHG